MAKYPTESKNSEATVISLAIKNNDLFRELINIKTSFLVYKDLVQQLYLFWKENHIAPDVNTMKSWCKNPDLVNELIAISKRNDIKEDTFLSHIKIIREARIGRDMLELAELIIEEAKEIPHNQLLTKVTGKTHEINTNSSDKSQRTRSYYWQTAKGRWEAFKKGKSEIDIPFGIKDLDDATGGLHVTETEADLVCFYGKPGSYKSRSMITLAYNQARKNIPVMYITREMGENNISMLIDARESLRNFSANRKRLEFNLIRDSYLVGRYRKKYAEVLKRAYVKKDLPFWTVDCPSMIKTTDIEYELEVYKNMNGSYPQVVYLDYANLILPAGDFSQESEKFDVMFGELAGIGKSYGIPVVTAVRESRTGSLTRNRDDVDQEHIASSNSIAYHAHVIIHLDSTREDRDQNRLWMRLKKNRYGALAEIPLFVAPEYNYMGDRDITDMDEDVL